MGNQSQTFSINWTALPCLIWGAIPQHLHGHGMGMQDHSSYPARHDNALPQES